MQMIDSNLVIFFFSSRRRHTRYWRDWSSDVCSSDLLAFLGLDRRELADEVALRVGEGQADGALGLLLLQVVGDDGAARRVLARVEVAAADGALRRLVLDEGGHDAQAARIVLARRPFPLVAEQPWHDARRGLRLE